MDKLRTIVVRLNSLFDGDYNCSSFDALRPQELLDVLTKVLKHLEIFPEPSSHHRNSDKSDFVVIINVLEAIKYVPDGHIISPEQFHNGLRQGSKAIVYPILHFLLENQQNVKRRFYLSKFVCKINVPDDFLLDSSVNKLYSCYGQLVDEFWNVYSQHKKEETLMKETKELEDDIYQMRCDLKNLEKRLDIQKTKSNYSEEFFKTISDLVKETKRKEKLCKQFEMDKKFVENLTEKLHLMQSRVKVNNLEDLLKKTKEFRKSQEVYQTIYEDVNRDSEILERIYNESEPNGKELEQLDGENVKLQIVVNQLNSKRYQDTTLDAFANQLKALNKNKLQMSKQIIKIKMTNEEVLGKLDEINEILGGDFLKGKQYKEYISELKQLSHIYKKRKITLDSLHKEEETLQKTLKILYEETPKIQDTIQSQKIKITKEIEKLTVNELTDKVTRLKLTHETLFRELQQQDGKFKRALKIYRETTTKFEGTKLEFNEATGFASKEIEDLEKYATNVENLIGMEEEDLKNYEEETEKLQDLLIRYSQAIIETAGDVPYADLIRQRLDCVREQCDELSNQVNKKEQQLHARNEEILLVKNVLTLVQCEHH